MMMLQPHLLIYIKLYHHFIRLLSLNALGLEHEIWLCTPLAHLCWLLLLN